jgi:hypothetical protein
MTLHALTSTTPERVAMLPDGYFWHAYEVPSRSGILYVNPDIEQNDRGKEIVDAVLTVSQHGFDAVEGAEPIGSGVRASVCRVGELAVKRFKPIFSHSAQPHVHGLLAIRASVVLQQGLERMERQLVGKSRLGPRYSAPIMYACFVRGRESFDLSTWAMSFEEGEKLNTELPGMPTKAERIAHYDAAISLCGVDPKTIEYDNDILKNLLVRTGPDQVVTDIIKLDVMGRL